jgi:hypothetical protein
MLRKNEYLENFDATGTLTFDASDVKLESAKGL